MIASTAQVTENLALWRNGDPEALNRLMPLVYNELRRLASSFLRREYRYQTLQTTALVHEAYLRLVDQTHTDWKDRAHFFGIAAQLMRRILVDHARIHQAGKRGGGARAVSLDENMALVVERDVDLLALDQALDRLAAMDPRQTKIVEMRYFAGLSIEETAEALGISHATVEREWHVAKAWLYNQISGPHT
ncbi:MAG TPA: sigma-70 family RNA polymerase sigma factor [Blastocatellia bacterium]|nr:sigma-70 family RNA polymerase sigma factor [Blastocatellia bacterium]